MTRRGGVPWRGIAIAVVAAGALAVLRPWTIQPIATATPAAFDPASYVSSIWETRVLPEAERSAVEVSVAARETPASSAPGAPPSRRSVFVKGTGVVTRIDRQSQVGLARVRMTDAGAPAEVAIQIGPVLRGTGLRDALAFVRFTDFVNQIEFASVSNALNERVTRDVIAPLEPDALTGKRIAFVGVMTVGTSAAATPVEILPVRIELLGDAK